MPYKIRRTLVTSGVRAPQASTFCTAPSILLAISGSPSQRIIIAALRMAPTGLAMPFPAISGALPWMGQE